MKARQSIAVLALVVAVIAVPLTAVAHCLHDDATSAVVSVVHSQDDACPANPHAECQLAARATSTTSNVLATVHNLKFVSAAARPRFQPAPTMVGPSGASREPDTTPFKCSSLQAVNCTFLI